MGLVDWLAGWPGEQGILAGLLILTIAGVIHLWQRWLKKFLTLPFMATIVAPFEQVLTPPDKTPVVHWNPHALTGSEVWGIIMILVMVGLIIYMARSSIKRSIARLGR